MGHASTAPQGIDAPEQVFDATTMGHLLATGVGAGWRCLEVGAGNGSVARWLAERVGPNGYVVATDLDPDALARLASQNIANLEAQRHDIGKDDLPEQSYDLIHVRLVLIHVPQRQEALARMVSALKPGGWLVIEDFDPPFIENRTFPIQDATQSALFHKMVITVLPQILAARGHETGWGRNLFARFREHKLVNVGMEGRLVVATGASAASRVLRVIFESARGGMVGRGFVTDEELDTFLALLDHPEFSFTLPIMMSAWGQRP